MRGNQEDQHGTCIASTPENDLRDRRGRLGGLIGGLLGALPYVALTLGSAAVSTTVSADTVLEEVIVTARKRDESIQDVPVAVTSITKELKQASVRRLEDIQSFAPNTFIRRSPGVASGASISIRGVGTLDTDKSLDPAIGVMMDGMFLGTASGVLLQNFDIERIEVLRGPQGILFGKNTTGGMINVIRGRVTMEAGADVSMAVDGNGRQDIKAVVNLPVIEDAAEALGSSIDGKACGSFGDFGILSFNGNKIITTSGGGALLSNNLDALQKARFLATQAKDNAPHYEHTQMGYNYRMSNSAAAIGVGQLKVLDQRVAARKANHVFYQALLANVEGVQFLEEPEGYFSNRWLSCIIINPATTGVSREDLRLVLEKENIESRPLWKPMHMQPLFSNFDYYGTDFIEKLFLDGMCLPSGSKLTPQEKERISSQLKVVFSC